jgi:tetratricopeptide (TPR) repeat protein
MEKLIQSGDSEAKERRRVRHNRLSIIIVTLIGLSCAFAVKSQTHQHERNRSDDVGRVNFRVSCSPAAQKRFNRAVAWLHSFEYEEAEMAFSDIAKIDPHCGMAYWGLAMSNYHPLWAPPNEAELQKGRDALRMAKDAGVQTKRESDYIAAIEKFYNDSTRLDHRTRTSAYKDAMAQLYKNNPADTEAGVFYALALITAGTQTHDGTYANEKAAAKILNRVLAREPKHPGVAHYLIHGYDYPALARLALPAARSYAKIAPASAHAQHMPSHIFTRLGLWQESVISNLNAEKAAKAFAARHHLPGAWDEQLHAMDYLAYAYLQMAQDKKAKSVLDELNAIPRVDPQTFKVAYAAAAISARYVLERRRWNEAAKLTLPQGAMGSFPWQEFPWAVAHVHFARAVGAARSGDSAAARDDVQKLEAIKNALANHRVDYDWATQVDIERLVAAAWLNYAEGNNDEALKLMRTAADLDDATEKHPVTPGAILPAREQLGELLLELKQPGPALTAFESALRTTPNRLGALLGATRAAGLAGAKQRQSLYYRKLVALTSKADTKRPELEAIRTVSDRNQVAGSSVRKSTELNR